MKMARFFGVAVLGLATVLASFGQSASGATNSAPNAAGAVPSFSPAVADVVRLMKSGVGDNVVIAFVNTSTQPYNLTADDILALRDADVSAPVVSAMLSHDSVLQSRSGQQPATGAAATAAPATTAPAAAAATTPAAPTPQYLGANSTSPPDTTSSSQGAAVTADPPDPLVEVVPVAPGPDYYWTPGYWGWNNGWSWLGGRWAPYPHGYYGYHAWRRW